MAIPFSERPLCTLREAEEAGFPKLTTLYRLVNEGRIEMIKIGGRSYLKVPSLLKLAETGADPKERRPPIRRGRRGSRRPGGSEPPEAA